MLHDWCRLVDLSSFSNLCTVMAVLQNGSSFQEASLGVLTITVYAVVLLILLLGKCSVHASCC